MRHGEGKESSLARDTRTCDYVVCVTLLRDLHILALRHAGVFPFSSSHGDSFIPLCRNRIFSLVSAEPPDTLLSQSLPRPCAMPRCSIIFTTGSVDVVQGIIYELFYH